MGDMAEGKASHCHVDHGMGNVETLLEGAHEPAPSNHPAEGSLDGPSARQHLEARRGVDAAHDLDDEVEERGLVG